MAPVPAPPLPHCPGPLALTRPGPGPPGVLCSSSWVPGKRWSADPKPARSGRASLGLMVGISSMEAVSGQRQQAGGEHILPAPGGEACSLGQSLGPNPGSYVQPGPGLLAREAKGLTRRLPGLVPADKEGGGRREDSYREGCWPSFLWLTPSFLL